MAAAISTPAVAIALATEIARNYYAAGDASETGRYDDMHVALGAHLAAANIARELDIVEHVEREVSNLTFGSKYRLITSIDD